MMLSVVRFLQPTHRGWHRAWAVIAAEYGDVTCLDPETNEVWQYMGTMLAWPEVHQFRHRSLPGHARTYVDIPAEPGDFDHIPIPAEPATT